MGQILSQPCSCVLLELLFGALPEISVYIFCFNNIDLGELNKFIIIIF